MFRSMMRKELMETRAVIAVASVVYALTLAANVLEYQLDAYQAGSYRNVRWSPVLDTDVIQFLWMIQFGFAIMLGLVQTLADSFQGTWGYLLHLPPGRRWVISSKLLVGGGAYLGCSGLFFLGCVLIGLTRQTEVHPFRWSMMSPYVYVTLMGGLLYLGTFLTGLRPSRWYVSRLLPLAGCTILGWVILALSVGCIYQFALLAVLCGLLVALILYIGETRDFA